MVFFVFELGAAKRMPKGRARSLCECFNGLE
jgi:hypothetical protein